MKRKSIILFLIIVILAILTLNIYASSASLQITGKDTIEPGTTGTMTVKLVSDTDTIGVVSGQIKVNANIENIQMQGKNGWQATYNKTTGEFNILKAEGAKVEDIADITYTIKSNATEKTDITISNIELTTIQYSTINLSDISKEVIINSPKEETSTQTPNPPKENQGPAEEKLPQTGITPYLVISIIGVSLVSIILYKKYNTIKDV